MNIRQATRSYEQWLRGCTRVIESELRSKHEQMRDDLLLFFRGTFYRWAQVWPEQCRDLSRAPKILAVGDLHVGSFGTWRDLEGRLAWGVDDFDDSYPLPYTNDLVRLATSVKIVIDSETLTIKLKDGCDAILEGYEQTLKNGGCPIVLAEHETNLEKLGIEAFKPPEDFWEKLDELPTDTPWVTCRLQSRAQRDASRPEIEIQSSSQGGGHGQPGPGTLRGPGAVARRVHRTGGQSYDAIFVRLAPRPRWATSNRITNGSWIRHCARMMRTRKSWGAGLSAVFPPIRIRLSFPTSPPNARRIRCFTPWVRRRLMYI